MYNFPCRHKSRSLSSKFLNRIATPAHDYYEIRIVCYAILNVNWLQNFLNWSTRVKIYKFHKLHILIGLK